MERTRSSWAGRPSPSALLDDGVDVASLRLAQGDHPKVVQEMLGHARISIALDLYSHLMPSLQAESAERFDKMLSRMAGR